MFGFEGVGFQLWTAGDPGLSVGDGETVRGKHTQERQHYCHKFASALEAFPEKQVGM